MNDNHSDIFMSLSDASFQESEELHPSADEQTAAGLRAFLSETDPDPDNAGGTWLSVAEAARHLGVSDQTIRRRIEAGELQSKLKNPTQGRPQRVVLLEQGGQIAPHISQASEKNAGEMSLRLIQAQAEEILFLRGQIEAQRAEYLAILEAERRESALTVAVLRDAIKAMSKS